jgi:hypothetical protein
MPVFLPNWRAKGIGKKTVDEFGKITDLAAA